MTVVNNEQIYARKQKRPFNWMDLIYPWIVPLLVILLWQAIGSFGYVEEHILPTPIKIVSTLLTLLGNGELVYHFTVSGQRVLGGFILGAGTGIVLGILTGFSRLAQEVIDPSLQMLRTVPLLALIPLFILWFGLGEFGKVLMIALGAFFPVYVNFFLGIRSVDQKLIEVSKILQISFWKTITMVVMPPALPNILLGLRLALGTSWLVLVVSEMMGTSAGLGYMIQDARAYAQTDIVFVGLIMFALLGKCSDSLIYAIERKCLRWRDTFKG